MGNDEPKEDQNKPNQREADLEKQVEELRASVTELTKSLTNKTEEAQRVHAKYQSTLTDLGGEEGLKELRGFREKRNADEQERLRKEGDWDKLEAQLRTGLKERDDKIVSLTQQIDTREVEIDLVNAAGSKEVDAMNSQQMHRLYAGEFIRKDGKTVHKEKFNDKGVAMTPSEFFLMEREKNPNAANLFRSTMKPGSGAGGGGPTEDKSGAVTIKMVKGQVPPDEQMKYEQAVKENRTVQFQHVDAPFGG